MLLYFFLKCAHKGKRFITFECYIVEFVFTKVTLIGLTAWENYDSFVFTDFIHNIFLFSNTWWIIRAKVGHSTEAKELKIEFQWRSKTSERNLEVLW